MLHISQKTRRTPFFTDRKSLAAILVIFIISIFYGLSSPNLVWAVQNFYVQPLNACRDNFDNEIKRGNLELEQGNSFKAIEIFSELVGCDKFKEASVIQPFKLMRLYYQRGMKLRRQAHFQAAKKYFRTVGYLYCGTVSQPACREMERAISRCGWDCDEQVGERIGRKAGILFSIETDVVRFTVRGIRIYGTFSIDNIQGEKGEITAYFHLKDDRFLTKSTSIYFHSDKPRFFDDFEIFMPYSQLNLATGFYDLEVEVNLLSDGVGWSEVKNSATFITE